MRSLCCVMCRRFPARISRSRILRTWPGTASSLEIFTTGADRPWSYWWYYTWYEFLSPVSFAAPRRMNWIIGTILLASTLLVDFTRVSSPLG